MIEYIQKAKEHLRKDNVKQIGTHLWQVGTEEENYIVRQISKPGRNFLTCSCKNDAMFVSESPLCSHKISVITFMMTRNYQIKLKKIIESFENYSKLNIKIDPSFVTEELKLLRSIF